MTNGIGSEISQFVCEVSPHETVPIIIICPMNCDKSLLIRNGRKVSDLWKRKFIF